MSGYLEVYYPSSGLASYVPDILTSGRCSLFFPAGFIQDEEKIKGIYRTEGYRKLSSLSTISTEDIFTIVLSILDVYKRQGDNISDYEILVIILMILTLVEMIRGNKNNRR